MNIKKFLSKAALAGLAAATMASAPKAEAHRRVIAFEHSPVRDSIYYNGRNATFFFSQYRSPGALAPYPYYRGPVAMPQVVINRYIYDPERASIPRPYGSYALTAVPAKTGTAPAKTGDASATKESGVNTNYDIDVHDNNGPVNINIGSGSAQTATQPKPETRYVPVYTPVPAIQPQPVPAPAPQPQQPEAKIGVYERKYPAGELLCGNQAKGALVAYMQWLVDNLPSYRGFSVKTDPFLPPGRKVTGDVVIYSPNGNIAQIYEMTNDGDRNQVGITGFEKSCYGSRTRFITGPMTESRLIEFVNKDF